MASKVLTLDVHDKKNGHIPKFPGVFTDAGP